MLDVLKGYYVTTWVIGRDVTEETVTKFKDPTTGALYAITFFRDGKPETNVVTKVLWDEAKQKLDAS